MQLPLKLLIRRTWNPTGFSARQGCWCHQLPLVTPLSVTGQLAGCFETRKKRDGAIL
jgi:hypothetical protein